MAYEKSVLEKNVVNYGRHLFVIFRIRNVLSSVLWRLLTTPFFREIGNRVRLVSPAGIEGIGNITIGDDVVIGYKTFLAARPLSTSDSSKLVIGTGCRFGKFNHIYATSSIRIGQKVLTANNVYIGDSLHQFREVGIPVVDQSVEKLRNVEIGDGAWLGHNVVVSGASVGRGSVIGANSVVTQDIPEYCVAVGAPARVIKRYNHATELWEPAVGA